MKPELTNIQNKLEERKDILLQRTSCVKHDISQEHSADWSEQAQERQNDEVLEAIGNESQHELTQINITLERITSGNYMSCTECDEGISIQRFEAVPYTHLCINCAE